jgi:hypothetical protein
MFKFEIKQRVKGDMSERVGYVLERAEDMVGKKYLVHFLDKSEWCREESLQGVLEEVV